MGLLRFRFVVVVASTHVLVREGKRFRFELGLLQRGAVKAVLQNRLHVAVGACADTDGAFARGLEALVSVLLLETEDPEARAVALLRVRAVFEDRLDQLPRLRADGLPPVDKSRGRPFHVLAVRLRHVRGDGRVATRGEVRGSAVESHALPLVEDLQAGRGGADLDALVDEWMGHGVEGTMELDVVVEVHTSVLPLGQLEELVGEWAKRGAVDGIEAFAPALPIGAHRPGIELFE